MVTGDVQMKLTIDQLKSLRAAFEKSQFFIVNRDFICKVRDCKSGCTGWFSKETAYSEHHVSHCELGGLVNGMLEAMKDVSDSVKAAYLPQDGVWEVRWRGTLMGAQPNLEDAVTEAFMKVMDR